MAAKFATVGEADAQKVCAAVPVGAAVVFTVAVTSNLETLSQLLIV